MGLPNTRTGANRHYVSQLWLRRFLATDRGRNIGKLYAVEIKPIHRRPRCQLKAPKGVAHVGPDFISDEADQYYKSIEDFMPEVFKAIENRGFPLTSRLLEKLNGHIAAQMTRTPQGRPEAAAIAMLLQMLDDLRSAGGMQRMMQAVSEGVDVLTYSRKVTEEAIAKVEVTEAVARARSSLIVEDLARLTWTTSKVREHDAYISSDHPCGLMLDPVVHPVKFETWSPQNPHYFAAISPRQVIIACEGGRGCSHRLHDGEPAFINRLTMENTHQQVYCSTLALAESIIPIADEITAQREASWQESTRRVASRNPQP